MSGEAIWQEWQCGSFGLRIAGRFRNGTGEPIIALHGWLDNAASFEPLAEHLPNPLFAIDMAGHGLSEHRPAGVPYHYVDNVRDVYAVLRALGWQRCIVLGHSMGAGIAALFAATFRQQVSRLIMLDGLGPAVTAPGDEAAVLQKAILDLEGLATRRKPLYATREQAIEARTKGFGGLSYEASAILCQRGLEEVPGGFSWRSDARLRLSSSLRFTEQQVEHFFRNITAPSLLVSASQGLGVTGMFEQRTEWIANLQRAQVEGCHHVHLENPQPVAAILRDFLAR